MSEDTNCNFTIRKICQWDNKIKLEIMEIAENFQRKKNNDVNFMPF